MDLVTPESGVYPWQEGGQSAKSQEKPAMQTGQPTPRSNQPPQATLPMRVSFNGDLLEVSAVLADAASVDRLVKALEANKALLPTTKKEEAAPAKTVTYNLGRWLSAALDDPNVCAEMKIDIRTWMDAGQPNVQQ